MGRVIAAEPALLDRAREAVRGTVDYVVATADFARDDRLWPADAEVFATNPLSLAYGACGPALFLREAGVEELRAAVVAWMLRRPVTVDGYPPGLYLGLGGIAYTLNRLGAEAEAREVMTQLYRSPLLYVSDGMLHGVAGWGWASLYFHGATGEGRYLEWAVRAGEHLLGASPPGAEDGVVAYGFGKGAAGVAVFLAQLHHATGDERYRVAAIKAMDFDLAAGVDTEHGRLWSADERDTLVRSYWMEGAAGVGAAAIRVHRLLGVQRHRDAALQIAEAVRIKHTISPGQFNGLAGIAELMLDLFDATGDRSYHAAAADMADTILWYRLERASGTAWPGRWLDHISNDYATGAAGIGLFLLRLLSPGPRIPIDLTTA